AARGFFLTYSLLSRDQFFTAPLEVEVLRGSTFVSIGSTGTNITFYNSSLPSDVFSITPACGDSRAVALYPSRYTLHPISYTPDTPHTVPHSLYRITCILFHMLYAKIPLHHTVFSMPCAIWNFAPIASRLECKFGEQSVPASFVDSHHVTCTTPPPLIDDPITVRVRSGTSGTSANFTYYHSAQPPLLSSLSPSFLPLHSTRRVIVRGSNLAPSPEGLLCRYRLGEAALLARAIFVDVARVDCPVPQQLQLGSSHLSVSTDRLTFSQPRLFTLYNPLAGAEPLAALPRAIPLFEQARVLVEATNLAPTPQLACRFGALGVSAAQFVNSTRLICTVPMSSAVGQARLQLSLDGASWSKAGVDLFFFDPMVAPTVERASSYQTPIDEAPGGFISLYGQGFAPTTALLCCYSAASGAEQIVPGRFVSSDEVECPPPRGESADTFEVRVAVEGKRFGSSRVTHTLFDPSRPPEVSYFEPAYGHYQVSTTILLRGSNFAPSRKVRVRWGGYGEVEATFVSSTTLVSRSLPFLDGGSSFSVPVQVMFGGINTSLAERAYFTFYDEHSPPELYSISPTEGRCKVGGAMVRDVRTGAEVEVANGSEITLRGSNFAPTPELSCTLVFEGELVLEFRTTLLCLASGDGETLFGLGSIQQSYEYTVPAEFDSAKSIRCTTPQLGAPSAHNQLNSAYKSLRLTGDCLATPIVLWMSGFLLIVLIIMLACFVCIACRAAGSSEDGEIQKELLTRIVREVGSHLHESETAYVQAREEYMRMIEDCDGGVLPPRFASGGSVKESMVGRAPHKGSNQATTAPSRDLQKRQVRTRYRRLFDEDTDLQHAASSSVQHIAREEHHVPLEGMLYGNWQQLNMEKGERLRIRTLPWLVE
ncbi:MAG: hypothetical protein SGPRY_010524, partial [Prymnesium sp.]